MLNTYLDEKEDENDGNVQQDKSESVPEPIQLPSDNAADEAARCVELANRIRQRYSDVFNRRGLNIGDNETHGYDTVGISYCSN